MLVDLTDQCVVDGHFKGIVWSHNKPQQVRLRTLYSTSNTICSIFKPGRFQSFQVSSHLLVFEDFLQNSSTFPLHLLTVLLLHSPSFGMDVAEDEVELGVAAALVRPKHDGVRGLVRQLAEIEVLGAGEELDVPTAAVEAVLERHLVLQHQLFLLPEGEGSLQLGGDSAGYENS